MSFGPNHVETIQRRSKTSYSLSIDYVTRTGNPDKVPIIVDRSESRCDCDDYIETVSLVAAIRLLCRRFGIRHPMLSVPEYGFFPTQLAIWIDTLDLLLHTCTSMVLRRLLNPTASLVQSLSFNPNCSKLQVAARLTTPNLLAC